MKLTCLALSFVAATAAPALAQFTGDLAITDASVSPSPALSGQTVRVDFFVQNLGPGPARQYSYEILVDGVSRAFSSATTDFPAPGDVRAFNDTVPMPTVQAPTNVDILVRIVDQQGEFNNTRHTTVTVNPITQPDLAVDTPAGWSGPLIISTSPGASQTMTVLPSGRPTYVSFGYRNLGSAFSSPTVRASILLDGTLMIDHFYPAMAQGERRRILDLTDLGTPAPGTHTLELRFDDGDVIQESDESNNTDTITFRVDDTARANLNFSLSAGSPRPLPVYLTNTPGGTTPITDFEPGDTVYANLSIRNVGEVNSTDFDVAVLLDGQVIDSFRQPAIAFGSEALITDRPILTNLQAGGTLAFTLDANNETVELDETDNTADVAFTVGQGGGCLADYNGDGFVDFFDYADFVSGFESGNPPADFNRDGFLDFFDYSDFVDAFETGGC